ncbi:MAG: amino acid permease [Candidatus Aenigmarchaeota archaeon]|nr:amino acid permease [Candidatus Aenigmarchaeota archaeon]
MPEHEIPKKKIGWYTLFFLSINAIVGVDIFLLPAIAAGISGPASIMAWILMSIAAVFMASYFAELLGMFPKAGGVYEYTKKSFGSFASFMVGWMSWIIACIIIAISIIGALYIIFPGASFLLYIIVSLLVTMFFNYVSYRGLEQSAKLLMFFGVLSVALPLMLIVRGAPQIDVSNFTPFFANGFSPILLTFFFIANLFFGWDGVTYLAEEIKDSRKTLPRILVLSTVVISVVTILLVAVVIGTVHWSALNNERTSTDLIVKNIFGERAWIFVLLLFIPLIGTAASWIVSSPRLLYAMSVDKSFPRSFGKIHEKYGTPYKAILFQAIISFIIIMVGLGSYTLMLSMVVPLVIIVYVLVFLSVLKLRIDMPNVHRYFKAPFGKVGPVVVSMLALGMLAAWLLYDEHAIAIMFLDMFLIFFGIPFYIMIKLRTDSKFVESFFDRFSFLWDMLFPIWYGKNERNRVLGKLSLKKNDYVLDFGCGTGFTTAALAKRVPLGEVIAVDLSRKQLEHAANRVKQELQTFRKEALHVEKIDGSPDHHKVHNVTLIKEAHPKLRTKSFDAITAVGVLEYFDDPSRQISRLMGLLKKGGRFSFLSFGKSTGIPAPEFLKDESAIRKLFGDESARRLRRHPAIELHIKKESKKLTEYWYIWGKKL